MSDAWVMAVNAIIVPFEDTAHRHQVIALWEAMFGYETAHNRPCVAIDKKVEAEDGLFFVAVLGDQVIGTVMAGYDGHRGWIYSVAVHPEWQKHGLGHALVRRLVSEAEGRGLRALYLLTMTAEHYFPRFGFERVARDSVPADIAATAEFRSACPASATVMMRPLEPPA